jgi:hypothetical protein
MITPYLRPAGLVIFGIGDEPVAVVIVVLILFCPTAGAALIHRATVLVLVLILIRLLGRWRLTARN